MQSSHLSLLILSDTKLTLIRYESDTMVQVHLLWELLVGALVLVWPWQLSQALDLDHGGGLALDCCRISVGWHE